MADDAEVTLPGFRDVMRHLVHHAPGLSDEMRDQYRDAIDEAFPEPVMQNSLTGPAFGPPAPGQYQVPPEPPPPPPG